MAAQPRGGELRGLKALVGVLGALVVLGTALVIGVVIHRLYAKPSAASMTATPGMVPGALLAVPEIGSRLQGGDHIKAIATAGADVAIWVGGPAGDKVLLADPVSGRITVLVAAAP